MQIQNEEATRIIRDGAKLTLAEGFPQVLLPNVVPVMDMTPRFHRIVDLATSNSSGSTSTLTLLTAASDKDTYITGCVLSYTKDATCDIANGRINFSAVVKGASKVIACLSCLTLTAQDKQIAVSFVPAIKIDRGTAVTVPSISFTVGNIVRAASVFGYEVA